MDSVRAKLNENNKNRQMKIIIALITVIILIIVAILLELQINSQIDDVVIMKKDISEEKAVFISLKELDTNIIAVKSSDGKYKLAFDDCTGCYSLHGIHSGFKNNNDNTGLICKNCKSEIMYDEMGFLPEQSMPLPITINASEGISIYEDKIVISAEYLENMKENFSQMRVGKSLNSYRENPNK